MNKFFNTIFPILDQLYIFQNFEYQSGDFLKWFLKHPFKRHLQRKHALDLTLKAVTIGLLAMGLILTSSFIWIHALTFSFQPFVYFMLFTLLSFIIHLQLSPLFLILAKLIVSPVESYQKQKILKTAEIKQDSLSNLKVVAIVGSFGKTSTKNMLYTLVWKKFRVVKTPKSFNTQLSIAKTILSDLKGNSEVFLVEMDAYHPGEIAKLCQLVKPDLGVITAIAAQHLERFGSMESLAATQFELANNLSQDSTLFLNSTDEWSMKLFKQDATYHIKNGTGEIEIFGLEKDNDLFASEIKQTTEGVEFYLNKSDKKIRVVLPLFGSHHVINFIAASAIALKLGLSLEEIKKRAKLILPTPHRMEIKKMGQLTMIDNSYNTNPTVAKSSLAILAKLPGTQKIIITPGFVELGKYSFKENQQFATSAAQVADQIIIVGRHAQKALLKGLSEANFPKEKIHLVKDLSESMNTLYKLTKPQTVVLLENDLPDQYF